MIVPILYPLESSMRFLTLLMVPGSALAVEYAEILSVETLVAEADQAAQGTVMRTESEWGEDGLIYTRVELDASNSLLHWASVDWIERGQGAPHPSGSTSRLLA